MNPVKLQNPQQHRFNHDILPPPMQSPAQVDPVAPLSHTADSAQSISSQSNGQSAFPPLGTTLPNYAPTEAGSALLNAADTITRPLVPSSNRNGASWKRWLKRVLITLLVIGIVAGGYVGAKLLTNAGKALRGNLLGLLNTQKLQGEDTGHVNILLAGNSSDDAGHSGGDLTDSIMIISVDTVNQRAFLLSVPRDLWVKLPSLGYNKINSAYVYGKANKFNQAGLPNGGMGELESVIETNFGININYYALVNYAALRDAVNAVGGIDVTIASSSTRGLYDPSVDYSKPGRKPLVKLSNGLHHLDGQESLNLARARGDAYGAYGYGLADFTRTANQRLMLSALKDKATTASVVSNPVKLGSLLDSFGNNVQTDFKTSEIRRLYDITKAIPSSAIVSVSLNDADGKNLLANYNTYDGQAALIPAAGITNYSYIAAFIKKLQTPPVKQADPRPTVTSPK